MRQKTEIGKAARGDRGRERENGEWGRERERARKGDMCSPRPTWPDMNM